MKSPALLMSYPKAPCPDGAAWGGPAVYGGGGINPGGGACLFSIVISHL